MFLRGCLIAHYLRGDFRSHLGLGVGEVGGIRAGALFRRANTRATTRTAATATADMIPPKSQVLFAAEGAGDSPVTLKLFATEFQVDWNWGAISDLA